MPKADAKLEGYNNDENYSILMQLDNLTLIWFKMNAT